MAVMSKNANAFTISLKDTNKPY